MKFRIGIGYDLHRLVSFFILLTLRREVETTSEGLWIGHSDGDVLSHVDNRCMLGACGLGNIGEIVSRHRSSAIEAYRVLKFPGARLQKSSARKGYEIGNIDSNILAQRPKLPAGLSANAV